MDHQCGSCDDRGCTGLCKPGRDRREWTMGEAEAFDEGFVAGAASERDEMRAENAQHMARLAAALAARDRLKAALEEIAADAGAQRYTRSTARLYDIARAALDGQP